MFAFVAPYPKRRAPMTRIGVIGSSRTPTGSRLATKTILAKSVIWLAGKSQKCQPPNIKIPNIKK